MERRKRRSFTKEFGAETVRLCKVGDPSIAQVAKELDLTGALNPVLRFRPAQLPHGL